MYYYRKSFFLWRNQLRKWSIQMAVPINPVRIYTSSNLGAQQIAGGALDFLNVLKQVVSGTFTTIQTIAVAINGTKAVITCSDKHGLYPYQVVKLTNTGVALENKEFFVLNDENFTDITFSIDLGVDAVAMPNVITINLPNLNWEIVEDSTAWLSFRPRVDKRIPLWRFSKTANNPTAGTRRVYSTYLARDVNLDGTLIKNYTPEQWVSHTTTGQWSQTDPCAWMVIADESFMYFILNRPCFPYSGDPKYSFSTGSDARMIYSTPALCYQYGVPTMLLEDVPYEWCTVFNAMQEWMRDGSTLYDRNDTRRSYLNLSSNDNSFLTPRLPYDFQGNFGYAKCMTSWSSAANGLPYPNMGTYGLLTAKNYLAVQGKGYFAVMKGVRSLLADCRYLLRDQRPRIKYEDPKVVREALHMGLMELNSEIGKQPIVTVISGSGDRTSGNTDTGYATIAGIRVGCNWKDADIGGL